MVSFPKTHFALSPKNKAFLFLAFESFEFLCQQLHSLDLSSKQHLLVVYFYNLINSQDLGCLLHCYGKYTDENKEREQTKTTKLQGFREKQTKVLLSGLTKSHPTKADQKDSM